MTYSDYTYALAITLMGVMSIYFFIIFCFGTGYRTHSFIILVSCLIGLSIPDIKGDVTEVFIRHVNTSILLEGVTAFSLAMVLFLDKLAWKQALLLAFATICHIMVLYNISVSSSFISLFFYNFYDELIILIGISQMAISYNGIITALRNLREHLSGFSFSIRRFSKGLPSFKRSGEGS